MVKELTLLDFPQGCGAKHSSLALIKGRLPPLFMVAAILV